MTQQNNQQKLTTQSGCNFWFEQSQGNPQQVLAHITAPSIEQSTGTGAARREPQSGGYVSGNQVQIDLGLSQQELTQLGQQFLQMAQQMQQQT